MRPKKKGAKCEIMSPGIKKFASAAEKMCKTSIEAEVRRLSDLARVSIVVDSKEQVEAVKTALTSSTFTEKFQQTVMKDRWAKDPADGYKDVNYRFRDKQTGMLAEVQVHLCAMMVAKNGEGHALYEDARKACDPIDPNATPPVPKNEKLCNEANAKMKALYKAAETATGECNTPATVKLYPSFPWYEGWQYFKACMEATVKALGQPFAGKDQGCK